MSNSKERSPTLTIIIVYKIVKATLMLLVGFGVLKLRHGELPDLLLKLIAWVHINVEAKIVTQAIDHLRSITPRGFEWIATGSILLGSLHLLEGIGLWMRKAWGGWLAIIQALLFVPVEVYEIREHYLRHHRWNYGLIATLAINLIVVLYLLANRKRLFGHHAPKAERDSDSSEKKKKKPDRK